VLGLLRYGRPFILLPSCVRAPVILKSFSPPGRKRIYSLSARSLGRAGSVRSLSLGAFQGTRRLVFFFLDFFPPLCTTSIPFLVMSVGRPFLPVSRDGRFVLRSSYDLLQICLSCRASWASSFSPVTKASAWSFSCSSYPFHPPSLRFPATKTCLPF